jgi:hypothetical protein
MRLDHVSYAASHDQISDVVNRIGSQIGTAFIDGGIHPKFGTRNFTAPLLNGQYIEIVCPLDHPATDATPFGQAVKKKADAGGGWLTWVLATNEIQNVEKNMGRKSILGQRRKPDGTEIHWKQLGVLDTINNKELPFFIEWINSFHPSLDGKAHASITEIKINGDINKILNCVRKEYGFTVENNIDIDFQIDILNELDIGVTSIKFKTQNGFVDIL